MVGCDYKAAIGRGEDQMGLRLLWALSALDARPSGHQACFSEIYAHLTGPLGVEASEDQVRQKLVEMGGYELVEGVGNQWRLTRVGSTYALVD